MSRTQRKLPFADQRFGQVGSVGCAKEASVVTMIEKEISFGPVRTAVGRQVGPHFGARASGRLFLLLALQTVGQCCFNETGEKGMRLGRF